MTEDSQLLLLENGEFGQLLNKLTNDTVGELGHLPVYRQTKINNHMLSVLSGDENQDPSALGEPTYFGNFIHRMFSIHNHLLYQIEYSLQFLAIASDSRRHPSENLGRIISYYMHDLFVLNERLKKLAFDASHLVSLENDRKIMWVGRTERNGKPGQPIVNLLEGLKEIRTHRNANVHEWDYEDNQTKRLSSMELWIRILAMHQNPNDQIVSDYRDLLSETTNKWSRTAVNNTTKLIEITDSLIRFMEPKLNLRQTQPVGS